MEPYILIVVSAIWFILGYTLSDLRKKKSQNIYRKGYEVRYMNKNDEYDNAIIWDNTHESSHFIIVKKKSDRYTPVYIIKRESVVKVTPIESDVKVK